MLAYLHHHHAVAYDRLQRLMDELFGLAISEGAIANALRRACGPLTHAGAQIAAKLRAAAIIGCDETGARLSTDTLGTRMAWEWVLVSERAVLHRVHPSRGRAVIDDLLGGHRPRCWVADRWTAQQDRAETHQLCLAHVLRDVQYAIDAGEAAFAPALRRLLCWAVAVGRRRADLKDATLAQYRARAERRLDRVLAIPVTTKAGADLLRQTKRWRSQFFTFITDRQVPPHQQRRRTRAQTQRRLPKSHKRLPIAVGRRRPRPHPIRHRHSPPEWRHRPSGHRQRAQRHRQLRCLTSPVSNYDLSCLADNLYHAHSGPVSGLFPFEIE